jgi:hypothetical protein
MRHQRRLRMDLSILGIGKAVKRRVIVLLTYQAAISVIR